MAITIVKRRDGSAGNFRWRVVDVNFGSSYPTGGESFTPGDVQLGTFYLVLISPTKGIAFEMDYTNNKIIAYVPGVTTSTAGSGVLDDFPITGVGATSVSIGLTSGNTTMRFGVMKEVANATDLSSITGVRVLAIGN